MSDLKQDGDVYYNPDKGVAYLQLKLYDYVLFFKAVGNNIQYSLHKINHEADTIKNRGFDFDENFELVSPKLKRRGDEIYKMLNARDEVMKAIFDCTENSDMIKGLLRRNLGKVQTHLIQRSSDPTGVYPLLYFNDAPKQVQELLLNPNILIILKDQVHRHIAGEDNLIITMTLKGIQSLTKVYPDVASSAQTSAGKTIIMFAVLYMIPEELKRYIDDTSKTAPRKYDPEIIKNVKIFVYAQKESSKSADILLLLSSSRDNPFGDERVADIYDSETGELKQEKVIKKSKWTTTIDTSFESQEGTRYDMLYLNESIEQTKKIIDKDKKGNYPLNILVEMGEIESDKIDIIRDAIKVINDSYEKFFRTPNYFDQDIYVPYWDIIPIDENKVRARSDKDKIKNILKASALLHMFQRDVISNGERNLLVANLDDWKIFKNHCLDYVNMNYYKVSKRRDVILKAIKENCKEWEIEGGETGTRILKGINQDDIVDLVRGDLSLDVSTIKDELKQMGDEGIIDREYVFYPKLAKDKNWTENNKTFTLNKGFYCKIPDIKKTNIVKADEVTDDMIIKATNEWYDTMKKHGYKKIDINNKGYTPAGSLDRRIDTEATAIEQ